MNETITRSFEIKKNKKKTSIFSIFQVFSKALVKEVCILFVIEELSKHIFKR